MSDQDQPDHEPGFDDPAHDDVRALLADARVTDPLPADVAARLDATLASLTADRRGANEADRSAEPAAVVPLRRRARLAPRLLVAAAAVVVVGAGGIGLSEVLGSGSTELATSGVAESDSAGDSPDFGPADPDVAAPSAESPEMAPGGDAGDAKGVRVALPRFTTVGFATETVSFDLRRLTALASTSARLDGFAASPDPQSYDGNGNESGASRGAQALGDLLRAAKAACPGPVGTSATVLPITFDGAAAALAVHPVTEATQLFEAWSCDGRTRLASTVVPR